MRTETVTKTIYAWAELPDETKDSIVERMYDINVHDDWYDFVYDDWYDFVYDDAKEIGALLGIDVDHIYFSGFSNQGDGAQFVGGYSYAKGSTKAVKEHAPQDKELNLIAEGLQELQRRNFYSLSANVKSRGRYSHAYCTDISVYDSRDYYASAYNDDSLCELLRDFMNWIYSRLEQEYEWLTTKESIIETIVSNEYEFYSDGTLA